MTFLVRSKSDRQTWANQVQLLVKLYGAAIAQIQKANQHRENNETSALVRAVLRSERLILEIVAGLDPSLGEIPRNVARLCHFCLGCLDDPTEENLGAAERVLTMLAEGFGEIMDEVRGLELSGELPPRAPETGIIDQLI